MEKKKLLHLLTGTEEPKFITEREGVMIDKFLEILKGYEQEDEITETKKELLNQLREVRRGYTTCISTYQGEINRHYPDSAQKHRDRMKPANQILIKYFKDDYPFGLE